MYIFSTEVNQKEYDSYVKNNQHCSLLQSYKWADVKDNWDHMFTGVYNGKELVCCALVLIKKLPMSFSMFYLPRGPVMDFSDEKLLHFYFNELKKVAKKRNCLFIKMDPSILVSDFHLNEDRKELDYHKEFNNILSCHAVHYGFNKDFKSTVQPRYNMIVFSDEFGIDALTKKGKKNIRIAEKNKLEICIGREELLDDFVQVMQCTEKRKQISLRSRDYYLHLLQTYEDDAFITLSYFNIEEMLKDAERKYKICLKDLENCPEIAKKKRFTLEELKSSLEMKINNYNENLEKYGKRVCVCGTLTVVYGNTSEILYAGMNETFKRLMGPYLTWYKTLEHCFSLGCRTSNMGGIEGDLEGGLVEFKEVFYPRICEYVGEFDLPVNEFLYQLAFKMYRKFKARKVK